MNHDNEFSPRDKKGRFKSPHSGNRQGRPRKPHNLLTALNRALTRKRIVVTNTGVQKLAGIEMIAEAVVKKAAHGDLASFKSISDYLAKNPEAGEEGYFITYAQAAANADEGRQKVIDFIARVDARKAREAEAKKAEAKKGEPDDGTKK